MVPMFTYNSHYLKSTPEYKRGLGEKKINLDDDFIKFVRYGQHLMEMSGIGALGFITNNVFLEGLTHRQMRHSILECFNYIEIVDLHGSMQKREQAPDGGADENVFDIKQGVAISVLAITAQSDRRPLCLADIYGKRNLKYKQLSKSFRDMEQVTEVTPLPPAFFFKASVNPYQSEYEKGWSVPAIMPFYNSGIQTKKDSLTIHYNADDLNNVLSDLRNRDVEWLRNHYGLGPDGRDWKVKLAKDDVTNSVGWKFIVQYRPFDFRYSYYTGNSKGFIAYPRKELTECLLSDNLALATMRQVAGVTDECEVFATKFPMTDRSMYSTLGTPYLFPLYFVPTEGSSSRFINLSNEFLRDLALSLKKMQQGEFGLPDVLSPEDIFNYIYAILHSPTYRTRYAEFLKIDFPRIPLASSLKLFQKLSKPGGELVSLHLLESSKINQFITQFTGEGDNRIPKKPTYKDGSVWINANQRFENVPEAVWNFHVGGYQTCEKWLKERKGRRLNEDDIAHYQKIVVALNETIRLMQEIDAVITLHGGWPAAFQPADN